MKPRTSDNTVAGSIKSDVSPALTIPGAGLNFPRAAGIVDLTGERGGVFSPKA